MGCDKALVALDGRPMLAHVLGALRPQVGEILLNSNADPARFAGFDVPVMADTMPGQLGPLAGLLTALQWAALLGAAHVLTLPCDVPGLPCDLVMRLQAAGGRTVIAASGGRLHPVIGLHPTHHEAPLRHALQGGMRRMQDWLELVGHATAPFENQPLDPFANINTPADLRVAQGLLSHSGSV